MISIYAPTNWHDQIKAIIQSEDRLSELVQIIDYLEKRPIQQGHHLIVNNEGIKPLIDWYNQFPPYLLQEYIAFQRENFLGLIFARLNNFEKATEYLEAANPNLLKDLDIINRLQYGVPVDPNEIAAAYTPFDEYRIMHNQAIVYHYGAQSSQKEAIEKAKYYYLEAFQVAPNNEYRAFTGYHFAQLLVDQHDVADAQRVINVLMNAGCSTEGHTALLQVKCQAGMQTLSVPYDTNLLTELKEDLWSVIQQFESQDRLVDLALTLTDAGIIANYAESWSESLGYFNRALAIFEEHQIAELVANVQYRKGILFNTWAENGNPQFYQSAAQHFREALKVFNQQDTPLVFAEIQHQLGIIYAEIPDDIKKKGIWAAVSSSAFQEAMEIYKKLGQRYEYAAVCNHYGNALLKYPEAKLTDNVEKALFYYQEALNIRSASDFPVERALTLMNYLEAQWHLSMPEDQFDQERFKDMQSKAQEALQLTNDPEIQQTAQNHLDKLIKLQSAYA